jgi:SWI/SNF-related matrix-associated actin-dependent regulator of chromatin subfamily A member 5
MARCHRIGQTKPVTVYRLISQDSVEEQALTRLAKKLYLSVKVTTAATKGNSPDDQNAPTFSKYELIKLLRQGTTAITAPPVGDDWAEKPIEHILKESRARQRKREEMLELTDEEAEKMERELLKDQERIRTNLFQGKVLARTNKEITDGNPSSHEIDVEWRNLTKRARTERTVMIDGFAISKESLACREWEAFPTFSANFVKPEKRNRAQFDHQDWCQHCREGGELFLCTRCPRVFHAACAGSTKKELLKTPMFHCPQHNCSECFRNTSSCGGMLFRCQTCADSFWYCS